MRTTPSPDATYAASPFDLRIDPLGPSLTAVPKANPSLTCLGADADDEGVAASWRCSATDDVEAASEATCTGAESIGGPCDMTDC